MVAKALRLRDFYLFCNFVKTFILVFTIILKNSPNFNFKDSMGEIKIFTKYIFTKKDRKN